jgi:uncharacterized membrane protein YdjX (TVP38/TMEM64 family)
MVRMENKQLKTALRLACLAVILAAGVVAWRSGAVRYMGWQALAAHRVQWAADVSAHPVAAPFVFAGIYALGVALSLPVALCLSLLGGLLFGVWLGGALTVIGACTGAVLIFLIARGLLAPFFQARLGPHIARLRPGLERDGFGYLLALRLVPIFPFWVVNLAPALLGMKLAPYALATIIGMVPISLVLSAAGAGLGDSLAAGSAPSAAMLLRPKIFVPLLAMAGLALLPVLLRQLRARAADTA